MKTLSRLSLVILMLFQVSSALAQPIGPILPSMSGAANKLIKFDLDFRGGTPRDLVAAIQKAMGRSLNAVVSDQNAEQKLPPVKMKGVDVAQLFNAMLFASIRQTVMASPDSGYTIANEQFGFRCEGPITDDSVWYFVASVPPLANQEICRFYLLKPYLQAGLTVDDITTAIQTSWKMLGTVKPPKLSFHKETNLLIAVGLTNDVAVIDDVLKALGVQLKHSVQEPVPTANETHTEK